MQICYGRHCDFSNGDTSPRMTTGRGAIRRQRITGQNLLPQIHLVVLRSETLEMGTKSATGRINVTLRVETEGAGFDIRPAVGKSSERLRP